MVKLLTILNEVLSKPSSGIWNGKRVEFGKIYTNPMISAFQPMHEAEMPGGKKLRIFDFDDTIVKTNSFIYVTHGDGKKSKLTPGEYAIYEPKADDKFDFSDFDKVSDAKELRQTKKILKRFVDSQGERTIVILTARSKYKPVKDYLDDMGYSGIYVVALGDSNPEKKAEWIEGKINAGYNDVFFIDDSHKNITAVSNLKRKYPNVKFKIQHIKY